MTSSLAAQIKTIARSARGHRVKADWLAKHLGVTRGDVLDAFETIRATSTRFVAPRGERCITAI